MRTVMNVVLIMRYSYICITLMGNTTLRTRNKTTFTRFFFEEMRSIYGNSLIEITINKFPYKSMFCFSVCIKKELLDK